MCTLLPPPSADRSAATSLAAILEACQLALDLHVEAPDQPELWEKLQKARREAASAIVLLAGNDAAETKAIVELQRRLAASGVYDPVVAADDLALAEQVSASAPVGLLAAMLVVPAWQWPSAPALKFVPPAYWTAYTAWLFHAPQGFCALGQAEAYGAHYLRRLEELAKHVAASPGAAHVRAALNAFVAVNNSIPLYFSTDSLRRHMELRGRLLTAHGMADRRTDFPATPRAGRRLRVGFVNRHFAAQTETYTTLPTFEKLDPARFEVQLFVHHCGNSSLEQHARGSAEKFRVLPADLPGQLKTLRDAALDVVVYGTNVTAVYHEVTRLALHRVAPLQVVNNSSCTTTGLPEIDLYVSGTATESAGAPAQFTERLGLLQGPAHAFNYTIDRQPPAGAWTRQALGVAADAVLFVSAANFYKIIPEMREAWARLLAAVPGSRLLLHPFNPNWSSHYPIKRFCAEFDRVLAAHGVASDRLIVSSVKFPSRTDVGELLKLGDLYLDTFPFAGVNSVVDPLEHGVPVVTQEGSTFRSRMGAALLRTLGLDELIATDADSYHATCVRLATDAAARQALRARIIDAMEQQPLFLDSLAASDGFGALLERAYDELASGGRSAFRRETKALVAPEVSSTTYRLARGRELLAADNAARAADYFLQAIQRDSRNATLWCELAGALRRTKRMDEAVQALQTCLGLDGRHLAGWRLLADLAQSLGHAELLAEANAMIGVITDDLPSPPSDVPVVPGQQHILLYTDDPEYGGVAQYNHSLMCGLVAAGYRVTCVQSAADGPLVQQRRALGIQHRWIPYDTKKDFARTLEDSASARAIFDAADPDLVIFCDCCPVSNLAARDAARQMGIPYVTVVNFVAPYLADRFKTILGRLAAQYASARAVVAVSQENLDLLRNRFGLPARMGQVIHYGRPATFFAPRNETIRAKLRAELGLAPEAVVAFTAARLDPIKGFLYQIVAAKHLVAQPGNEHLHFVWAGEGDQRRVLEQAIATHGLTGRVHLLGHRWDMADWYDAADIFVLPSDLEGMPLSIMEAMAKGLPVVASSVSGIPEELGDTGQLLPAGTKDRNGLITQLIRTLQRWTADADLRRAVGEAGRARAQELFRESLMLERTIELVRTHAVPPARAAVSA
jgi:predicted O-linked N-acetylglucosamine transferase (SPINDLY family)/glycosyltransferase involved in cell wall biosynthesis